MHDLSATGSAFSVTCAAHLAAQVTLENLPVAESPYKACICNASIAFPDTCIFYPLHTADRANVETLPERKAEDYVLIHDMVCILKSDPVQATGGEELPY